MNLFYTVKLTKEQRDYLRQLLDDRINDTYGLREPDHMAYSILDALYAARLERN